MNSRLCYVWSEELLRYSDTLPAVPNRASMVHSLLSKYGLFKDIKVVQSTAATLEDLKEFHSELYTNHLKQIKHVDDDYNVTPEDEQYGIGYDCAPVSNMYELVSELAGGSVTAAKALIMGFADVAINWCGGWHHANRFGAEGFCYVNDIVIAIEKLRKNFKKVLYIDLDVHHGNGVQDAYSLSKDVLTLSFHKFEPGFYPGTGGLEDIGNSGAKGYSINFPLKAAYSDETLEYAFEMTFHSIFSAFTPQAVVVQCGADALARDPHGGGNLTTASYIKCVQDVLGKEKPTMLLGGGGYNFANAARLWTSITASILNVKLDPEIPDHDYWLKYAPEYSLDTKPALIRDSNEKSYLDECIAKINENIGKYIINNIDAESSTSRNRIFKSKHGNFRRKLEGDSVKKSSPTQETQSCVYDFE